MKNPLPNNVALNSTQTTGIAFNLDSGTHIIAAGVTTGNSFPTSIGLQVRFTDETGKLTAWQNTDVELSTTNSWQDAFHASSQFEYQVIATGAAGATVHVSLAPLAVFN